MSIHWNHWIVPVLLFLVAFVSRILFIDAPAMSGDEPFTIHFAQASWSDLMNMFQHENNPPLFTILMKGWVRLFGIGEVSVRFPSLLFSSATVSVLYLIGRKYIHPVAGVTAALVCTFSSYHIAFAHEARPYALFGLLTALAYYLFLRQVVENKQSSFWLGIVNALLIYNHFLGFFVFIPKSSAFSRSSLPEQRIESHC